MRISLSRAVGFVRNAARRALRFVGVPLKSVQSRREEMSIMPFGSAAAGAPDVAKTLTDRWAEGGYGGR